MMNYAEMMMALVGMSENDRRNAILEHRQHVLADGFIAYMQSQIEQIDDYVEGKNRGLSGFLPQVAQDFMVEANKNYREQIAAVWESIYAVHTQLASDNASNGGSRNHPGHSGYANTGYQETTVTASGHCSRCGSMVAVNGLCNGCLDHDAFIEQDHLEYDQRLYEQQLDRQTYQQIQDDYAYYDAQTDFDYEY